ISPVQVHHRSIDFHTQRLHVNELYLKFWRICATESLDTQRLIWGADDKNSSTLQNQNRDHHGHQCSPQHYRETTSIHRRKDQFFNSVRQENFYRAFNTADRPRNSNEPPLLDSGARCPAVLTFPIQNTSSSISSGSGSAATSTSTPTSTFTMTLQFMAFSSHPRRLLQIHQYFESVLGLEIDHHARVALLVAFSAAGDMVTVQQLFNDWRNQGKVIGGKEMYSVVIRGLIGNNSPDLTPRDSYGDFKGFKNELVRINTTRNGGTTQVHAALELFYDLLKRGGTPTFEIYHSLIVGMAVFKNDMEAAEMLLDHMIVTKKKPYVQVLHVMCREYARRKDFQAAERIFGMLQEYGIRPKALTCNVMLNAIFRVSSVDVLEYMADHPQDVSQSTWNSSHAVTISEEEHLVLQWKRQKIQALRNYMQETGTLPDNVTFSTLFYGFGYMKDGYPDLRKTLAEMTLQSSRVEPNMLVLNSLLFAHLNHDKLKTAETILDRMLSMADSHKEQRPVQDVTMTRKGSKQQPSPFKDQTRPAKPLSIERDPQPLFPPKGAFHALMLAFVEHHDIEGMERILDKMIQAQVRQEQVLQAAWDSYYDNSKKQKNQVIIDDQVECDEEPGHIPDKIPHVNLEADEYTANIMLLGYLAQGDLEKAKMVQAQIHARPDWRSSSLFWERESSRQELLAFVGQQGSQEIVRRSIEADSVLLSPALKKQRKAVMEQGELDSAAELKDDIEIDVTTLSAKLKSLQKSIPSLATSSKK
ncbi:hypothetical protein BGZ83_003987, partial [Gryganskiella cystojenkinii]